MTFHFFNDFFLFNIETVGLQGGSEERCIEWL